MHLCSSNSEVHNPCPCNSKDETRNPCFLHRERKGKSLYPALHTFIRVRFKARAFEWWQRYIGDGVGPFGFMEHYKTNFTVVRHCGVTMVTAKEWQKKWLEKINIKKANIYGAWEKYKYIKATGNNRYMFKYDTVWHKKSLHSDTKLPTVQ